MCMHRAAFTVQLVSRLLLSLRHTQMPIQTSVRSALRDRVLRSPERPSKDLYRGLDRDHNNVSAFPICPHLPRRPMHAHGRGTVQSPFSSSAVTGATLSRLCNLGGGKKKKANG